MSKWHNPRTLRRTDGDPLQLGRYDIFEHPTYGDERPPFAIGYSNKLGREMVFETFISGDDECDLEECNRNFKAEEQRLLWTDCATWGQFKDLVSQKRLRAEAEAREGAPVVQSRGVEVMVCVDGERVDDSYDYNLDSMTYAAFMKAVRDQLAKTEVRNLRRLSVYASGGFDGANSVRELIDGDYDPYVSEWGVEVEQTLWTGGSFAS